MLSARGQLERELNNMAASHKYLADRIQAELDFAEGLLQLEPRHATAWTRLIADARALLSAALATGKADRLARAVEEAEELMAPIGRVAKTYRVHCVGHAHIDMNWLWSWPETVSITHDTFVTVLKLMEEFHDFHFSQSQASVYAIIRDHAPALLDQIRRRVKEGRWEVTAVHWVEGDKNLASGESLARHMLYTRRFMQELFGLTPEAVPLDWECDMFGHAHTLPGILVRGGASRYYMCRSGVPEKPPVFWWEGPDTSRVLVVRDITGYNDSIGPHVAANLLRFCGLTGLKEWMEVYGVGDHGGGPTRRDILRCRDMDTWPIYPQFRLATTRAFYEALEKAGDKWPVLNQEVNCVFAGCYTSQSAIKKANRFGENFCLEAETAAVLARRAVARAYPAEALRAAWINVLFGQFHDILPGSGVAWTREYQLGLYQETAAKTNIIRTQSLRAVADAVDTSQAGGTAVTPVHGKESPALGAGVGRGTMQGGLSCATHLSDGPWPFVIFNACAWQRHELVQATVWDVEADTPAHELRHKRFTVLGPDGARVPAQVVDTGDYWGHRFVDLVFPVSVASLGYATYIVEEGECAAGDAGVCVREHPPRHDTHQSTAPVLENDRLIVTFDERTGGVASLIDKASGCNLVDASRPLGILEYSVERSRGMSAWIIGSMQQQVTNLEVTSLEFGQRGPHLASVIARVNVASSMVTITYVLKAGSPQLELTVETMWLERGSKENGTPNLRMKFPFALREARARYEIPFGSITRDLQAGQEVPALRWANVTGRIADAKQAAGCAVMNDSKYGHALDGSTMSVTLIRSSYEPDPLPEIREHTIRLAVAPHDGKLPVGALVRLGAAFNHPLQVIGTSVHKGPLPVAAATAGVTPENIVISSVRNAQDEDAVIFHMFETAGKATTAHVVLNSDVFGQVATVTEVDFIERPAANSTARKNAGGFTVHVPAHGIAAVKAAFKP